MLRQLLTGAAVGALALTAACGDRSAETAERETGAAVETTTTPLAVDEIRLGTAVGSDRQVTTESDRFRPSDTIYASVRTSGTAESSTLVARWTYQDGQVVSEDSMTIAPNGPESTEFHISNPDGWPAGDYKLTVMLDGREVGSKDFEVGS